MGLNALIWMVQPHGRLDLRLPVFVRRWERCAGR
jgi:hypothetical protein